MTGENQATAMFRLPSLSYNYFAPGNEVLLSFGITNYNFSSFISPHVLLLSNTHLFTSILLMSSDTYNRSLSSYVLHQKKIVHYARFYDIIYQIDWAACILASFKFSKRPSDSHFAGLTRKSVCSMLNHPYLMTG